jgi:EpsI family protein
MTTPELAHPAGPVAEMPLRAEERFTAKESWSYGCVMARLAVDRDTGRPQVEQITWVDDAGHVVNFYSAYYASQRKGESVHSPRSCLPGGGWEIQSLTQRDIPGVKVGEVPLRVNRVLISYGEQKQVVYYWFQQRGRVITNEYLVKWYLFWDALTRNRTDGALVRLTTIVTEGEEIPAADARLSAFAAAAVPRLHTYIPE